MADEEVEEQHGLGGSPPPCPSIAPAEAEGGLGISAGELKDGVEYLGDPEDFFWTNRPSLEGGVIEFQLQPEKAEDVGDGTVACWVTSCHFDADGCSLMVKWLGSGALWSRTRAISLFSRGKRMLHVCRNGVTRCGERAKTFFHVDNFKWKPPGVAPPNFVDAVKKKEWQKLNRERSKGGAPAKAPPGGEEKDDTPLGVGDRVSRLRSRLLAKKGVPATLVGPPAADPLPARPKAAPLALGDGKKAGQSKKRKGVADALVAVAEKRKEEVKRKRKKGKGSSSPGSSSSGGGNSSTSPSPTKKKAQAKKKKKVKKKKKKSTKKKKRSRSGSHDTEDEDSSSTSMIPPLQRKALRKPGSVLELLLREVGEALADSAVQEEVEAGNLGGSGNKMTAYVQICAKPLLTGKVRDLRELETLGKCVDLLRSGRLPELGDALAGRFLAVERAGISNNWQEAQHLEVLPTRQPGLTSPAVMLRAQRHQRQVEKATGRGSWKGGSWQSDRWPPRRDEKGSKGKDKGRGKGKQKGKRPQKGDDDGGAWKASGKEGGDAS